MSTVSVDQLHAVTESAAKRIPAPLKWAAIVVTAVFCIYRLAIFTPQPLDSPGSLRPALFRIWDWWLHLSGTPEQMLARWSDVCALVLCIPPVLALLYYLWRSESIRLPRRVAQYLFSRWNFFTSIAACLLLCRFPILLLDEMNPDEGEFLFAAHKLFHDPNFFHAVDCHTSGPLNVYPLMLPAIFGASPDFASSRLIGLAAIFLTIYFLYRALALIVPDDVARLAILPVPAAFCVFKNTELLHMSSEHIPLLLISIATYLCVRVLWNPHLHRGALFLLGFTACAAFFTKMQSVPIIVAIGAVAILYVCAARAARTIWIPTAIVFAGTVPLLLLNAILCCMEGVWKDFWISYVLSNWAYPSVPGLVRTSFAGFLEMLFRPEEIGFLVFTAIGVSAAYIFQKVRLNRSNDKTAFLQMIVFAAIAIGAAIFLREHVTPDYVYLVYLWVAAGAVYLIVWFRAGSFGLDPIRWFGALALVSGLAAFLAAYLPHRPFVHYLLFLILPVCMAMAWMLARQSEGSHAAVRDRLQSPRAMAFTCVFITLIVAYQSYIWRLPVTQTFGDIHNEPLKHIGALIRPPEGDFIRSFTSARDQIRVWGWTVRPYLSSGRGGEGRDTHVLYCFRQDSLKSYYTHRFLNDMQHAPPAVFIDATGPTSWFFNDSTIYRFERFPEIARFVNANYVHLGDLYGQRYFLRRDVAAARDASFNVPLPAKACNPEALACESTAITLPEDLPLDRMPRHTLLQAEFTPVKPQVGPATVFNSEAILNSYRGFRFLHTSGDRYFLLVGTGDRWIGSKEFTLPVRKPVWLTITFNENVVTIRCNSEQDELHLPRAFAASPGPINLNSWIDGADPFIGKMQFFQVLDLEKPE